MGPQASGVKASGVARASHDQLDSWCHTGEAAGLVLCQPPESWHQGESADDAVVPVGPVPAAWCLRLGGQFPASASVMVAARQRCIGRETYTMPCRRPAIDGKTPA